VYNLVNLNEIALDAKGAPREPVPHIKSIEIVVNPFDDIVVRKPIISEPA
jgi:hypothetical protein